MSAAAPSGETARGLAPLAAALRHEGTVARVLGPAVATLAVAGPAQPFVLAGLLRLSERRPALLVTPTELDA